MKKILVAEDFDTSRKLVCNLLEKNGYIAIPAANGKEAFELIIDNHDFDLIITDFNMPKMDGGELVEKIREIDRYRYTPIFVLSTETNKQKKEKAMQAKITAWIAKPYEVNQLLKYVQKALK
ncbi:MAG: response regulator [Bacteroidales bacterium]|nr:response regulator [Bacteroidales bacterium]